MFGLWLKHGGDITTIELAITREKKTSTSHLHTNAYKTRADLMVMHNGNSTIVDAIVAEKRRLNQWSRRLGHKNACA